MKWIPCAHCGKLLYRKDRNTHLSFCDATHRAFYYATHGLKNRPPAPKRFRLNTNVSTILTTVAHYLKEEKYPTFVHRDRVIDYLIPTGKLDSMSDTTRKRVVSTCLSINNYDKLSSSSNAFRRRDDKDGDKEGKLPTSEQDAELIPGTSGLTG